MMVSTSPKIVLLSTFAVAKKLGVSPYTVKRVADRLDIPIKVGRYRCIPASDVHRIVDCLVASGRIAPLDAEA